eukprot:12216049-Alexandrium_andersonii.AAC.1
MLDGQTHGHEANLTQAFVDNKGATMAKEKRTIYMTCTEASVRKRRHEVQGTLPLSCVEYCHMISKT